MAKRGAETSLTKNNWQEENEGDDSEKGDFAEASADKLAGRTFVKVRRKPTDAPEAGTEFKLSSTEGASPAQSFNFDFSAAAQPEKNAFQQLVPPTNWECAICEVSNKKELTKCAACEAPRAGPQAVAPVNAFAALVNPNNWECPICEVSNKKDLAKCGACEAPKPGTEPVSGGFTFGAATATSTPFTFGSAAVGTGGFTFGATTSPWNFSSATDSPFTFGSGSTGAVTFGDVSGQASTFGTGSPTSFEPTDQLATGGDQTKEEFKNKAPEPSGTEKDVTIFKFPTTVYISTKVDSKTEDGGETKETSAWKFVECGEGEAKVNTIQDGDKKMARVVLRVEKTQRLVLNAPLFSDMSLLLQGEKYVKFCSYDLERNPAVYLLRFKNKTESTQMKEQMEKAIAFLG
jgi:rubredoxin